MTDRAEPILFSMIRTLDRKNQDIAIDALGASFMSGHPSSPVRKRDNKTGWVVRNGGKLDRALSQGVVYWTADKNYPKTEKSDFIGSFDFEKPIDENYTIKKVDGVWTILDRERAEGPIEDEQVTEEEANPTGFDDALFQLKLAKRFAERLGYEGEISEKDSIKFNYAAFTIYLFYKPKQSATKDWAIGWYYKGIRHGKLELYSTAKEALLKTFVEHALPKLPR